MQYVLIGLGGMDSSAGILLILIIASGLIVF